MLPSMRDRDILLVSKIGFFQKIPLLGQEINLFSSEINRLDIILFSDNEESILVKRAIGLSGDYYEFREKEVFINSKQIDRDIVLTEHSTDTPDKELMFQSKTPFYRLDISGRIPPDYYLLLGDNRTASFDSRNHGLIPITKLRGKVVYKF